MDEELNQEIPYERLTQQFKSVVDEIEETAEGN